MNKNLHSFAIIFLGLCILVGSWLIAQSLGAETGLAVSSTPEESFRYEMITPNANNIIIFDKQTGEYWQKFIDSMSGPTNWEKQISPPLNTAN